MQEITRRVNLTNIWQAAYTAGAVLPKPVATTQYWHRSLNSKKLISVGFSRLQVPLSHCPGVTQTENPNLWKQLKPSLGFSIAPHAQRKTRTII